jgi:hypothetical protein
VPARDVWEKEVMQPRHLTAEILRALEAAPMTLTELCQALWVVTGIEVSRRLKRLAALGYVRARYVHTYTTKIPITKIEGLSRVVWYLKSQPAPTIDVRRDQKPPALPKRTSEPRAQRQKVNPFANERREPAEVLAMLAGRTNFLTPNEGRSTDGSKLVPIDVAHALPAASDKFGAAVAMAVACQREAEWPKVNKLGFVPLLRELIRQRAFPGVVSGPLKHRARIVLWDAFHDYIRPKQRQSFRKAAKAARITESAYRFLHKYITAYLEDHKNTAAGEACFFLFAPAAAKRGEHALVLTDDEGKVSVLHAINALELMIAADNLFSSQADESERVVALMAEIANARGRSRSVGVLRLHGVDHVAVYINPTEEATA